MERSAKYSRLITMAASVVVIAVLYLAKGVLIPFALAMLVTFLLAPLVLRLQRWRFNRIMAVVTAVLLVAVVSGAAGWLMVGEVREVTARLSEYRENIQGKLATLRGVVALPVDAASKIVEDLGGEVETAKVDRIQTVRIAQPVRGPFEVLSDALDSSADALLTGAMALVFAFVMLLRRDDLGDRFMRVVGHGKILVTTRALAEATKNVSSYLWRLLLLNGMHGLVVGIGLAIIGVPNALLWGSLSAILRFIPYIGPWIAASFPILTALAVSQGWSQPLLTVGLFVMLELVSNNILEPWLYGKGTGISPLAILASALFWTWLWGPVGLVLSTPLTVCLVVMGKYVPQLQFLHLLFGDAPGLPAHSRLYQRLIAGDQDQAWIVLRAEFEAKPLHEVYDTVVLPALSLAEHDRERGALGEDAGLLIDETIKLLLEEAGELRVATEPPSDPSGDSTPVDALRVLCLPARDAADAMAATMLRQVLERDGVQVEIASIAALSGDRMDLLENRRVDIMCISAVPPSRFIHVRQLCKRIAARYPKLPIIAGMWTLELEDHVIAERSQVPEGVHLVTSLGEARIRVRQLAQSLGKQRDVPSTEPVAVEAGPDQTEKYLALG